MDEECWNEESWLEHCQVRDGQPAEGPLSMAFGWPGTIDPDDLATFEQWRNETAEIPQQMACSGCILRIIHGLL